VSRYGAGMKVFSTGRLTRRAFAPVHRTRMAQAATMTLRPGEVSDEASANEHGWAEQWLYVVSGTGTARIGKRSVALRAGSLLVIGRREPHQIRAGARSRLVTFNVYVPPAYDADGEPLPPSRRPRSRRAR
jgi:mannose-6-phosphate isomerase-like protein (cupin superfamily)